jgi:hypothetical protein
LKLGAERLLLGSDIRKLKKAFENIFGKAKGQLYTYLG